MLSSFCIFLFDRKQHFFMWNIRTTTKNTHSLFLDALKKCNYKKNNSRNNIIRNKIPYSIFKNCLFKYIKYKNRMMTKKISSRSAAVLHLHFFFSKGKDTATESDKEKHCVVCINKTSFKNYSNKKNVSQSQPASLLCRHLLIQCLLVCASLLVQKLFFLILKFCI